MTANDRNLDFEYGEWIISAARKKYLRLQAMQWPSFIRNPPFDFQAILSLGTLQSVGRGTDFDEDIALKKAVSEAIERLSFHLFRPKETTNGLACHPSSLIAESQATQEVIERDLVLCHFYSGTPFIPLTDRPASIKLRHLLDEAQSAGFDIQFYRTVKTATGETCILCLAMQVNQGSPTGFFLGTACKRTLQDALLSAGLECLRKIAPTLEIDFSKESISLTDFNSLASPTPRHHQLLAQNADYAVHIWKTYFHGPAHCGLDGHVRKPSVRVDEVQVPPLEGLSGISRISKASTSDGQEIFFGWPDRIHVRDERIREFVGDASWVLNDSLLIPHPLS